MLYTKNFFVNEGVIEKKRTGPLAVRILYRKFKVHREFA